MPRKRVLIFNQTRESVLSVSADVANGLAGSWLGPGFSVSMRPGGGLWGSSGRLLHSIGLTTPIDVVLLGPLNQVLEIRENFRPYRVNLLGPEIAGWAALPAGTISESKTEVGDELAITASEPMQQVLALYTNGGPIEPHSAKDVTVKGAFVETPDRWYPGTIVEMTLRYDDHYAKLAKMGAEAKESVQVRAKVVRAEDEGIQIEFVFLRSAERSRVKRFVNRV